MGRGQRLPIRPCRGLSASSEADGAGSLKAARQWSYTGIVSTQDADPTSAVPVPIEEDNTPLPVRIPLGRRPPPPPLVEGKLISLRSGGVLPLASLAKLRLLRVDDLGDDSRWLSYAPPKHSAPMPAALAPLMQPVVGPPPVAISGSPELPPQPPDPEPTFRWRRLLPPSGSLKEISAVQICGWAIATGFSGCLRLSQQPDASDPAAPGRELFFESGTLLGLRSSLQTDDLAELQGALWSQAQKKRALEVLRKARSEGLRKQLDLLVSAKLIDAKDFCQRQADYVMEVFCRALWPSDQPGFYRLVGTELPPGEQTMLPLSPRLLLTQAVRRGYGLLQLQQAVGPLSTVLVPVAQALPQSGGVVLQGVGLSSLEEDALLRFDGDRSLQEIAASSGLGEHALYGLAYGLLALGALAHPHHLSLDEQKRLWAQQKARARARALNDAMTAIQRKARLCESADYFTLLGIDAQASLSELKEAYQRERAALSPAVLPYRSRAAMDRELRQIALVLDEAYAVLSDPVRRACYAPIGPRS